MSKRANKRNKKSVQLVTTVKARNPEDQVFMEKDIPHKAYGGVLLVVDGGIGQSIGLARDGLKMARNIPFFNAANELPVTDPFVQFYRGENYLDEDGQPLYSLAEAQSKAYRAYMGESGPITQINEEALFLALMEYTEFEGVPPQLEQDAENAVAAANNKRKSYNLPPLPARDLRDRLERKLNHVRYMMLTDQEFSDAFSEAVQVALKEIQNRGLGAEEEETSDEGFQPIAVDGNLHAAHDAVYSTEDGQQLS